MNLFKSIFKKNNSVSGEKSSEVLGCLNCHNLEFEYDSYYSEHICTKCGWTANQTPNGNITIVKKSVDKSTDSKKSQHKEPSASVIPSDPIMSEKDAMMGAKLVYDCSWTGDREIIENALYEMQSLLPGGFTEESDVTVFPKEQRMLISVHIRADSNTHAVSLNQQFMEILRKKGLY